jgi:hypothetical protein
MAGRMRELYDHLVHMRSREPRDQIRDGAGTVKEQMVLDAREHYVAAPKHPVVNGARGLQVGPAAGTEIGVERHPAASPAREIERLEQPVAAFLVEERQGDAREVNELRCGEHRLNLRRLGQVEQLPHRSAIAPVEEPPLAALVRLDKIEARQPAGQTQHGAGANLLIAPRLQHFLTERIGPEHRDVVGRDAEPR